MNTLFHMFDSEWRFIATVRFEAEPLKVLGHEPMVGKPVWIGPPFHEEEQEYEIVDVAEEYEAKGLACALKLMPKRTLHS